jgi:predicted nucleotidyltransferase
MELQGLIKVIKELESPLKRQLLMVALITRLLEEKGKNSPIIIGGCALSYYTREVYFTADIDLAYSDREALHEVLTAIGFDKEGRYWINEDLKIVIEAPASVLAGEDSPIEIVEFEEGLRCKMIGIEDLIIDRLNACKHWKSEIDCEMVELLITKYFNDIDWPYLQNKAAMTENEILSELLTMKESTEK